MVLAMRVLYLAVLLAIAMAFLWLLISCASAITAWFLGKVRNFKNKGEQK